MADERVLVVGDSAAARARVIEDALRAGGYLTAEAEPDVARARAAAFDPHVVVAMWPADEAEPRWLRDLSSAFPVVAVVPQRSADDVLAALAAGAVTAVAQPAAPGDVAAAVGRALQSSYVRRERDALRDLTVRQHQEFSTLHGIAKTIASLLRVDEILGQVVSAAVELTGADEGSLLLIDEDSGELYLRASKNLNEAARNLRVKVEDSLMGEVIRTRRPAIVAADDFLKVKTYFLVKALLNVPLLIGERAIGVLSVDLKRSGHGFTDYDTRLLSVLADYAAIALENARLYGSAENERVKLTTILRDAQDAVIVTDPELRLILANPAARAAFGLGDGVGARLSDAVDNAALLELFDHGRSRRNWHAEILLADGRTLQGQLSELHGIGFGAVLQDISRLKELDRIKSDFISIVLHDLRTPLTTIRGYIELLPRVGPLNELQEEFVRRVERGTVNIVELIADLLDVNRIEAGLDWEMEPVDPAHIVDQAVAALRQAAEVKQHTLAVDIQPLPTILGNSRRLQQAISNLISNAIKYTPAGGQIGVSARQDGDFVMVQVRDSGIGIAQPDQVRIWDKFYRVESDETFSIVGTGLGLSIVKTVIERHKGRVWVESAPGSGSLFTMVLPRYAPETA